MGKTMVVQVRTRRLKLSPADAKIYRKLESFDWILFSSKNAARYFVGDVKKKRMSLPRARVAALGEVTASVLKLYGVKVHVVPEKNTAKDMAHSLGHIRGMRILFPRSDIASKDSIRILRKKGATVRSLHLYTTYSVPLSKTRKNMLLSGRYTTLRFKSPSGIHGMLEQFDAKERRLILSLKADCIGPTTARAAKNSGFRQVRDLSI